MPIARNSLAGAVAGGTMALLAAAVPAQATPTNLVVNGGFETSYFSGGWQFSGNDDGHQDRFYSGTGTHVARGPIAPHSGHYAAEIDVQDIQGQTLAQTITTVPGQTYAFTYWRAYQITDVQHEVGYLSVGWDNELVQFESYLPSTNTGWTEFTNLVTGTGSDTLSFYYIEAPPNYLALDDVKVVAVTVPEPTSVALLGLGLIGVISGRAARSRRNR